MIGEGDAGVATVTVDPPTVCPDCTDGKRRVQHRGTGEYHGVACHCQVADLPLRLVIQPERMGCVLAAVATVVGKSYGEIRQLVDLSHDFTEQGTFLTVAQSILERLGYAYQLRYSYDPRLNLSRPEWPCAPWAAVHICEVQNLTETGQHAVVLLRDGRVLDPWWGIVQGLHRYRRVVSMMAVYPVAAPDPAAHG